MSKKPTAGIRPIPTKMTVGIHDYEIVIDKDALISAGHKVDYKDALCGLTTSTGCRILVDHEMSHSQIQETILHEALHAMYDLSGATFDLEDNTEERLVRALAPVLLRFLRDNPKLLQALGVNV